MAKLQRERITQIGFLVRNIDAATEKWAEFLQVEKPPIFTLDGFEKAQTMYRGKPCHALIQQSFFSLDNIQVELITPVGDEPSIWRECLDRDGEGLHHLAFEVKDMAANLEYCENQGMPLLQKGEYNGGRYAYVDGMTGLKLILELLENDEKV